MRSLSFLFFFFLVSSCLYEPDEENFIEISKQGIVPRIENHSLDLEEDTIYVWANTRFDFDFRTDIQNIIQIEIQYEGKSHTFYSNSGYFDVDPTAYEDGVYPLTIKIYTNSGTGSIADKVGAEAIVQQKTWIMVFDKFKLPGVKFTHTSIENGMLEVHWEKCTSSYFRYYELRVSDSAIHHDYTKKIYNRDSISLTDPAFVGGSIRFELSVGYLDAGGYQNTVKTDDLVYKFRVNMFFTSTKDTLTIAWNRTPFNHTASLYFNSATIEVGTDTSYRLKSPGIGFPVQYQLALKPTVQLSYDHLKYYVYASYTDGTPDNMNFSSMKYIPALNMYYRKHAMFVRNNDNELAQIASYNYPWDNYDNSTISVSPDQSILYTTVNHNLVSLNPATLEVQNSQHISVSGSSIHLMQIVNDSVLFLGYDITVALYNYKRHKIIDSAVIGYYGAQDYYFSASADGKYIAYCGDRGLRVYENEDNKRLVPLLSEQGNFLSCLFDPVHTENLLVVTLENNYFLRCSDLQVIQVLPDSIKGMPANFDPVTNYLLFVSFTYKTVTVYDVENDEVKYSWTHHGYFTDFYLGNNYIFNTNGYHVKIN